MMVSFKTLFFLLATLVTLAQAGSHAHHKRYQYRHYHNGTEATTVVTSTPLGTGIKTTELPAVNSSIVETTPAPISTRPPIQSVTTACVTKYETKTYTYTLGNGKAHTTTITHSTVITQTITPVPEPTKVDSIGDHTPGANAEEVPDYTSTSTSTTTVFVTVTRTLPLPKETTPPIVVEQTPQAPCPVSTVYVTVPVSVSVTVIRETVVQTVKETVRETMKETITVTQNPVSEQPPVHTPPPVHPLYSNHTTTTNEAVRQVTMTIVPIPYE